MVELCPLAAGMGGVRRMNRRPRSRARPDLIRGPRVVAIGEENTTHTVAGKLRQIFPSWLHRIDAEISSRVQEKMAVEVVAVRLGKPRPGEYAVQDLSHLSQ